MIDTNFDETDQPFILGTTNAGLGAQALLTKSLTGGETAEDVVRLQQQWLDEADLCTYAEAVSRRMAADGAAVELGWADAEALAASARFGVDVGTIGWCSEK